MGQRSDWRSSEVGIRGAGSEGRGARAECGDEEQQPRIARITRIGVQKAEMKTTTEYTEHTEGGGRLSVYATWDRQTIPRGEGCRLSGGGRRAKAGFGVRNAECGERLSPVGQWRASRGVKVAAGRHWGGGRAVRLRLHVRRGPGRFCSGRGLHSSVGVSPIAPGPPSLSFRAVGFIDPRPPDRCARHTLHLRSLPHPWSLVTSVGRSPIPTFRTPQSALPTPVRVFRGCTSTPKGTGVGLSLPLPHLFAPNVFAIAPLLQPPHPARLSLAEDVTPRVPFRRATSSYRFGVLLRRWHQMGRCRWLSRWLRRGDAFIRRPSDTTRAALTRAWPMRMRLRGRAKAVSPLRSATALQKRVAFGHPRPPSVCSVVDAPLSPALGLRRSWEFGVRSDWRSSELGMGIAE